MKQLSMSDCFTAPMNSENLWKKKNVLTRSLFTIATALCLFFVGLHSANAKPGIQVESSGAHYGTALYEEVTVDLEVKVMGGMARIKRQWKEETVGQWIFNPDWTDLDLKLQTTEIARNGYVYKRANPTSNVYRYLEQNTIVQTEAGFRWADRKGNWIDYDAAGKILAYGDRNNVKVSFTRDASGRISQVLDHFGTAVITLAYNTQNQVIAVSDYSGRQVVYTYTGSDLSKVKDVRGYDWLYEYQTLLNRRVLSKKIDPEGRFININHTVSPGGRTCVASSGGSWVFNEEKNQWELVGGKCTRYLIVPPTLLFTGTSDAIGVISKNQYFFDAQSQTYNNTWLVNGRRTTQKINLRGEVLREEINGELQSETKVSEDRRRKVETDGAGRQTVYEFDEYGNRTKIIYPDKSFEEWTYDRFSNVIKHVDSNGTITVGEYDARGNITKRIEALSLPEERVTIYEYDNLGNLKIEKFQGMTEEVKTQRFYDDYGNLIREIDPEMNEQQYQYDVIGNITSKKDARGNIWRNIYDENGDLIETITPMGFSEKNSFDKVGNILESKAKNGLVTAFEWDARNRFVKETKGNDGEVYIYQYDGNDNLVGTGGADGMENFQFDSDGRLIRQENANGNAIEQRYVGFGDNSRLIEFRSPHGATTYEYDFRGRIVRRIASGESAAEDIRRTYDVVGNLTSETDSEGVGTFWAYDRLGRVKKEFDSSGVGVSYEYDDLGNIVRYIDPRLNSYESKYDRNGRLVEETDIAGKKMRYEYDANGNLTKKVDKKGNTRIFLYDKDNRKIEERIYAYTDLGNPERVVFFSYDQLGGLIGWDDGDRSSVLEYDPKGRLIKETIDFGNFSSFYSYAYEKNGSVSAYTDPHGIKYEYEYDSADQLVAITIPQVGRIVVGEFSWYLPSLVSYPGGVRNLTEYDAFSRMIKNVISDSASNTLNALDYRYDNQGNLTQLLLKDSLYEFTYDARGRVSSRSQIFNDENYEGSDSAVVWDTSDNLSVSNEVWTYNSLNQLMSRPGYLYSYDDNGNLVERIGGGESLFFAYDASNRLRLVTDSLGTVVAEYAYDPFGRRIFKNVAGGYTYYLYNLSGLASELSADGEAIRSYGIAPDSEHNTNPLFMLTEGQYYFYINNQLGAPIGMVDSTGRKVWAGEYNEFGRLAISLEDVTNPLRNPGQYDDVETGFYYNYHRYYDPLVGRYTQLDPLGFVDGPNQYLYGRGNALKNTDPTGEAISRALILRGISGYLSYICVRNQAICKELGKCILNPGKCKKRFCNMYPNQTYHGPRRPGPKGHLGGPCDQRGCEPDDKPSTRVVLSNAARACVFWREFVATVCFGGKMDDTHRQQLDDAKKKLKDCEGNLIQCVESGK